MLSTLKLALMGSPKIVLPTLPQNASQEVLDIFTLLATMNDKQEKPFSQILSKMLVDTLSLEQVAALASVILERRFSIEGQNAAMVFRNSEFFAHQIAYAVLHKIGYPFDPNDKVLELLGIATGISLTPRSRERGNSTESTLSSFSVGSVLSGSSDDIAVKLATIPPAVVTLLLPFYCAYVGNAEAVSKAGMQQAFIGHFSFSFFTTPLQSTLREACAKDELLEQSEKTQKFNIALKELATQKDKLWGSLLNTLEAASANYQTTPLPPQTLTTLSQVFEACRSYYANEMMDTLRRTGLLAEMFTHLAHNPAHSPATKEYFKLRAKTMKEALEVFNHQLNLLVLAPTRLDFNGLKLITAELKLALDQTVITYLNAYTEGLTLLQRLVSKKTDNPREIEELVMQVKLLIELGVNVKATTESYEGSNASSVRKVFANLTKGKLSTAAQSLTAKDLAEKVGNRQLMEVLAAAEAAAGSANSKKFDVTLSNHAPVGQVEHLLETKERGKNTTAWLPSVRPSTLRTASFLSSSRSDLNLTTSFAVSMDAGSGSSAVDSSDSDIEDAASDIKNQEKETLPGHDVSHPNARVALRVRGRTRL